MEPEIGLAVEKDLSGRRPPVLVRAGEMAGLGLVIFGLAENRFMLALLGAALVAISYAVYRRKHGWALTSGRTPDSDMPGEGD